MRMLNEGLPLNVNLLTLDPRPDGKYLLRLEHIYDVGEDEELSKPVMINLRKVSCKHLCLLNMLNIN